MKLFSFDLKTGWAAKLGRVRREEFLVWGVVGLFIFLVFIILLDGYLFYQSVLIEEGRVVFIKKPPAISSAEIDEMVRIFDERKEKLEEILRTK